MRYEWDETKNEINIHRHGIDFEDARLIFDNPILLKPDLRRDYGEDRLVGLGFLVDVIVVIVFTKRNDVIRVISIRRANKNERKIYQEKCFQ